MRSSLVVVGLGYVGLPLARVAAESGFAVTGLDASGAIVDALSSGQSHVDDVSDADVRSMLVRGFRATNDPSCLSTADTIVICVPTPLSDDGGPDLTYVRSAMETVAAHLRAGQLVILESTTYPGTTEEVLVPILESSGLTVGKDVLCAFSPERIDPGNSAFGLRNTPKVVGGVDQASTDAAAAFYSRVVDEVVIARGVREAELAKLVENTYRHVNIALMNELVRFCHELDIDLWDAIRCASTKPFGFQAFYPGPGVGGHCIPIDPNYLSHRVRTNLGEPFRFVELAQEINAGMPSYVARRVQGLLNDRGRAVRGSTVLLLGVTYKADIADQRESPATDVARALMELGASIRFHDPHVGSWDVDGLALVSEADLQAALEEADAAVLIQAHRVYRDMSCPPDVPILDTRGVLSGDNVVRL